MDSFAISVGGTSKAMAGMVADMEKTQAAFTNLDASEKAYANGLNLLAAAQVGVADPIKTLTGVARDQAVILEQLSSTSLPGYGKSLSDLGRLGDLAVSAANRLNDQLNVIRTTAPEVAKGFTEEYFAIQKMATGSDEQAKALVNLNEQTAAAAKSSEDFTAKLALQFPKLKDAGVQYTTLVTNIEQLSNGYKLASAANLTEQQTMALLGPIVNNVAKGYETFGVQLRQHNPTLVAAAEAAHGLAAAVDPLAVKMHELALAVGEQTKAFSGMLDAVDAAARKSGDYRAALTAEHSEIDSEIISLEKQKATTKGLTDAEQARLTSLLALHKVISDLTPEQEKFNKVQEDSLKSVHDLSKSYEDLTRAREKDKTEIENHRKAFVAGVDAELAKAMAAGDAQIRVLNEQHKNMEISDSAYAQSLGEILNKESLARRAAIDAEDRANEEAAKKEKEHEKTYEELAGAVAVSMGKVNETLVSSKGKQAEYDAFVATSLAKVRGQWDETSKKVKEHGDSYGDVTKQFDSYTKTVETGTGVVLVHIDEMTVKVRDLKKALAEVNVEASKAFGGGGADAGAGATPGSEGF